MRLSLCLLILVFVATAGLGAVAVTLRPQAAVAQGQITLGDIAAVTGPADQAGAARSIVLAPAPPLGATRPLRKEQVEWRLAQGGLGGFTVTGPAVVTVSRATQELSAAELDRAAQDCLRQAAGELGPALELTPMNPLQSLTVPAGQVELRAQPSGASFGSTRQVSLTVLTDGQVARSITVGYRLRLEVEAPVAVRSLSAGELLSPACWATQRCDVAAVSGRPLAAADLAGRRLRRSVAAGAVLTTDNTEPVPLVLRNQPVLVIVRAGALVVTCEGVARADAGLGQTVEIMNADSRQVFSAVVTGQGRAEIAH